MWRYVLRKPVRRYCIRYISYMPNQIKRIAELRVNIDWFLHFLWLCPRHMKHSRILPSLFSNVPTYWACRSQLSEKCGIEWATYTIYISTYTYLCIHTQPKWILYLSQNELTIIIKYILSRALLCVCEETKSKLYIDRYTSYPPTSGLSQNDWINDAGTPLTGLKCTHFIFILGFVVCSNTHKWTNPWD